MQSPTEQNFKNRTSPITIRNRVDKYTRELGFKTGDIIAFNDAYWGKHVVHDLDRQIQRLQQQAPITHVGIIYIHLATRMVYVVEAVWYTDTETTIEAFTGTVTLAKSYW